MEIVQYRRGSPLQPRMSFTDQNYLEKIPAKYHVEVRTV